MEVDYSETLKKVVPDNLHVFKFEEDLLTELKKIMPNMRMGLHIYEAGSEGYIWDVAKAVKPFSVDDAHIMKEQTDTLARNVYCVHCKAVTRSVTTNIVPCCDCELM